MERVQVTWSSGGIFQPSLFELPSSLKTTADEMADTGGIFFGKINRVLFYPPDAAPIPHRTPRIYRNREVLRERIDKMVMFDIVKKNTNFF
jgi:hypothetical protein